MSDGPTGSLTRLNRFFREHAGRIAAVTLVPALIYRWLEATSTFINPDEAQYFEMAIADTFHEMLWRSTATHHPPLLVILLHWITRWTVAEGALRLVPVLAGVLGPWFAYRWLSLVWNRAAGYLGLLLLAFSPSLIWLGAQARGYSLALLGAAVSLYGLERAMRENNPRGPMFAAAGGLYLAIWSEYNAAFFAGAAGVYFLVRARTEKFSGAMWRTWAAMQAVGVASYVALYIGYVRPAAEGMRAEGARAPGGYIYWGFPHEGYDGLLFVIGGALKQAAYLGASIAIGAVFLAGCAGALWLIWSNRDRAERARLASTTALPVVSFLLAAGSAFAGYHPFMGSRHTSMLLLPLTLLAAPGLARLFRGREGLLPPLAVVVALVWPAIGRHDPHNIPVERHQRVDVVRAAEVFCREVPDGARVVTDHAAWRVFRYYLTLEGCGPGFDPNSDHASFKTIKPDYTWWNERQVYDAVTALAAEDPAAAEETWILDGGWQLMGFRTKGIEAMLVERFEFNSAMRFARLQPSRLEKFSDEAAKQGEGGSGP